MAFIKYCKILIGENKALKINGNKGSNTVPAGVQTEQGTTIRNLGGKDVIGGLKEDLHHTLLDKNQKKLILKKHNLDPTVTLDLYKTVFWNNITGINLPKK